jgi:signal transduction histidine kinase/CheY-like chemotaxis protein
MIGVPAALVEQYKSVLNRHVCGESEDTLHQAYEFGRRALSEGVTVIQLARLHHKVLESELATRHDERRVRLIAASSDVLAEAVSVFDMVLRGYKEANAKAAAAYDELSRAHAGMAKAHEQLKNEIADRKRAEAELLHAQKLTAVGLLAGGVAHNFNNLLTIILGNLEFALRQSDPSKARDRIRSAQLAAERGAQVTQQLLSFSRKQILAPQLIDLRAWIPELQPLIAGSLRSNIIVETTVADTPLPVFVDVSALQLAILNLVINSRDAMPSGGRVRLWAGTRAIDGTMAPDETEFVCIEVADTGEGMDANTLQHAFEPFFTTKDVGSGTGLGLSQVHGFAHQSGGTVQIQSDKGRGTAVRIYLPRAAMSASEPSPQTAYQNAKGKGHVLVVDDDGEVAAVTAEWLRNEGYVVTTALSGERAFDVIEDTRVDIVVCDVVMPGMNGIEFQQRLKESCPDIPVILLTGYGSPLSQRPETSPVLRKPFRIEDLTREVERLLCG